MIVTCGTRRGLTAVRDLHIIFVLNELLEGEI